MPVESYHSTMTSVKNYGLVLRSSTNTTLTHVKAHAVCYLVAPGSSSSSSNDHRSSRHLWRRPLVRGRVAFILNGIRVCVAHCQRWRSGCWRGGERTWKPGRKSLAGGGRGNIRCRLELQQTVTAAHSDCMFSRLWVTLVVHKVQTSFICNSTATHSQCVPFSAHVNMSTWAAGCLMSLLVPPADIYRGRETRLRVTD